MEIMINRTTMSLTKLFYYEHPVDSKMTASTSQGQDDSIFLAKVFPHDKDLNKLIQIDLKGTVLGNHEYVSTTEGDRVMPIINVKKTGSLLLMLLCLFSLWCFISGELMTTFGSVLATIFSLTTGVFIWKDAVDESRV